MKEIYHAPNAVLTVFKPKVALADVLWSDLLENQYTDNSAAEKESGDITITL